MTPFFWGGSVEKFGAKFCGHCRIMVRDLGVVCLFSSVVTYSAFAGTQCVRTSNTREFGYSLRNNGPLIQVLHDDMFTRGVTFESA
jgi:hypothetical protein